MFIDLIVAILLVIAVFKGMRKGLIVAVFSFVAFIVGLAAALKLSVGVSRILGENINIGERWLPVLAFVLVFILVVILVRMGARLLESVLKVVLLGWLNRIGGVFFYALMYLFILSILLFYADQTELIKEETLHASVTYAFLQPLGPKAIYVLSILLPFFRDMFSELSHFFENVSGEMEPSSTSMNHNF